MGKNSFDENRNEPFDYFKEVGEPKKPADSGLDNLISSMRPDMPLASDAEPAKKNIFEKVNLKVVVGVLLGLFVLSLFLFILAGPGRSTLEHSLAALIHVNATATQTDVPTQLPATQTPAQPSSTPLPSPTPRPSSTATPRNTATSALPLTEASATPSSACRDALTISLADVGQTLCVKGTVIETVEKPNAFMVVFSNQPGAFYWVSYDMVWSQAEPDTCYQITGKIEQIANSPILLFDYSNIPEVCP
jgi:hypothetical protein